MSNRDEERQKALQILDTLRSYRNDLVRVKTQLAQLEQKKRLLALDIRRAESAVVIEVNNAKDDYDQPLCKDIEVKRAMVEDRLSRNEKFTALMHKDKLLTKNLQRKQYRADTLLAKITDLESREKLLILA